MGGLETQKDKDTLRIVSGKTECWLKKTLFCIKRNQKHENCIINPGRKQTVF